MTSNDEREHPVANPDRTFVDDDGRPREAKDNENMSDPHDQEWPEVAREVKEAVEHPDGPLD